VTVNSTSVISVIGGPSETSKRTYHGVIDKKTTYGGTVGYNVKVDGQSGIQNFKEREITVDHTDHPFWK
jgi:hypothetical protein